MSVSIECRKLTLLNTDPQRRCYNGCHAESALAWGAWFVVREASDVTDADDSVEVYRRTNPAWQYRVVT